MSFLEQWFGEFFSFLDRVKPSAREVNTTVIPFATQTTKLVDKSLPYCKLLFVSVEGNLKNSDLTTIKYKLHDAETWLQKQIYGVSHAKFNAVIDKLEVTPNYEDIRYGRCIVTYEGDFWSGKYVGVAESPHTLMDWIGDIKGLMWSPKSFIQNPYFQQGFAGWLNTNVTLGYTGLPKFPFCKFPDLKVASIEQYFPIPLGVDWLSDFYLELSATKEDFNVDLLRVDYYYSDKTSTSETLQCASSGFLKKVLSPTNGKYLCSIRLHHLATHKECGVRSILTVF